VLPVHVSLWSQQELPHALSPNPLQHCSALLMGPKQHWSFTQLTPLPQHCPPHAGSAQQSPSVAWFAGAQHVAVNAVTFVHDTPLGQAVSRFPQQLDPAATHVTPVTSPQPTG